MEGKFILAAKKYWMLLIILPLEMPHVPLQCFMTKSHCLKIGILCPLKRTETFTAAGF